MNEKRRGSGRWHADGAVTSSGHVKYSTLATGEKRLFWAVLMICAVALVAAGALGVM